MVQHILKLGFIRSRPHCDRACKTSHVSERRTEADHATITAAAQNRHEVDHRPRRVLQDEEDPSRVRQSALQSPQSTLVRALVGNSGLSPAKAQMLDMWQGSAPRQCRRCTSPQAQRHVYKAEASKGQESKLLSVFRKKPSPYELLSGFLVHRRQKDNGSHQGTAEGPQCKYCKEPSVLPTIPAC